jgi:hypothetical protein
VKVPCLGPTSLPEGYVCDASRQITGNFRLESFRRSLLVVMMHSQHDRWPLEAPGPTVVKQSDDAIHLGGVARQRPCYGEQFDFGHVFADNKRRLIRDRADC